MVGGMLCVVTEETLRVIAARRLLVLREFTERLAAARDTAHVFAALHDCRAEHREDLPFTLTFLADAGADTFRLAQSTGLDPEAPSTLQQSLHWPIAQAIREPNPVVIDDLGERFS